MHFFSLLLSSYLIAGCFYQTVHSRRALAAGLKRVTRPLPLMFWRDSCVKEGMAAAKALSKQGAASRESSQTREGNPSRGSENPFRGSERTRGSDRTRTESYRRGEVQEGRHTSRERRDYSQNRTSAGESCIRKGFARKGGMQA